MTKDKNILISNVYHMLAYAFQTLNQEQYEDLATESFDEMYDLLAAILSKGIIVIRKLLWHITDLDFRYLNVCIS